MNKLLSAGFLAAALCAAAPAWAGQINFDDLTGIGGQLLPSNYAGFTWGSNWAYEDQTSYNNNYGNSVSFPSAPNVGFNGFGVTEVDMFAPNPTVFTNAMVATWAENNQFGGISSTSITVEGWNGATEEWSVTEQLAVAFQQINFGSAPVTELKFLNNGVSGDWWLIDDINYGTAVPEPGSLALLGAGLAGLGGWRLRRKAKSA